MLCEKPLAPTIDACLRVLEAEAAKPRRLVQVGFMRRYDEGFRALKATLDAGRVGRPLLLHCRHRNADVPPGFTSDMMITDSVVHDIDVTRWLLGQEIVATTVFKARQLAGPRGLQDPQMVVLETAEGVLVDVESFVTCQYGYDIRYELVGESGTVALGEHPGVQVRAEGGHHGPIRPTTGSGSGTPTSGAPGVGRGRARRPGGRAQRLGRLRHHGRGRGRRRVPDQGRAGGRGAGRAAGAVWLRRPGAGRRRPPGPGAGRHGRGGGRLAGSLGPAERAKAGYPFPADEERTRWYYTPTERGGLPLAEMGPVSQRLAHRLVASGLSEGGYATAATVMGLENVLDAKEGLAAGLRRPAVPTGAATPSCTSSACSASPGPAPGAGGSAATTWPSTTPSGPAAGSRPARCSWGPTWA